MIAAINWFQFDDGKTYHTYVSSNTNDYRLWTSVTHRFGKPESISAYDGDNRYGFIVDVYGVRDMATDYADMIDKFGDIEIELAFG